MKTAPETYVQIKMKCPIYLIGLEFFGDLCYLIGSGDIQEVCYQEDTLSLQVPLFSGIKLMCSEKTSTTGIKIDVLKTKYKIETITCDQNLELWSGR